MIPSSEQHKAALDAARVAFRSAYRAFEIDNPDVDFGEIELSGAITAYLASLPEQTGERWQHVKRGTVYTKVGIAELQMSFDLLVDGSELVVYRGDDGKLWCLEVTEFEDGRFVPAPPAGEAS